MTRPDVRVHPLRRVLINGYRAVWPDYQWHLLTDNELFAVDRYLRLGESAKAGGQINLLRYGRERLGINTHGGRDSLRATLLSDLIAPAMEKVMRPLDEMYEAQR